MPTTRRGRPPTCFLKCELVEIDAPSVQRTGAFRKRDGAYELRGTAHISRGRQDNYRGAPDNCRGTQENYRGTQEKSFAGTVRAPDVAWIH
jgi:hypothetical protein